MDRLASEGMIFERAYCSASVCNPSRASLLSGIKPSSSGIYNNSPYHRESDVLKDIVTLPGYFKENGYHAISRGKIFHHPGGIWADSISWNKIEKVTGSYGHPANWTRSQSANGMANTGNFDWGPTDVPVEDTPDYQNAQWAAEYLKTSHDKPFFMAVGIFRPHLPWYVPKEFFEKFPLSEIKRPEINVNDLDDIENQKPSADYLRAEKYNKHEEAVQAYLASINYADYCVGVILDALDKSPYKDNTIIVFWGDHGWHLGEKLRYKKFTLWEESCRMPLLISVPGMADKGETCVRNVSLLDLYPTLVELCDLPENSLNDGNSIVPLLENPKSEWNIPALTTMGFNNHTVRTERWRYIIRDDGSEELYDHSKDQLEWENLAGKEEYRSIIDELKKSIPTYNHPEVIPGKLSNEDNSID